jgi:DNA-binding XRE family transcriptional regulator
MGATQLAHALNIATDTVYNWERIRTEATLYHFPQEVAFLGHTPCIAGQKTLRERVLKLRNTRGVSQTELASRIGINPTTLSKLEKTQGSSDLYWKKCLNFLMSTNKRNEYPKFRQPLMK